MNETEHIVCDTIGATSKLNEKKPERDTTKISGIYKIINKINRKYYVGSSDNILGIGGRWREHTNALNSNSHHNSHLQRSWNKYGKEVFNFLIIEQTEPTREKLLETEQKYLDIAKTERTKCYNSKFIAGGGSTPIEWTVERRENMSKALKGRIISEEWRKNMRKPRTYSKETRKKLFDYRSNRMKGNKFWKGKKHSEKTLKKMSETQKRLVNERVEKLGDNYATNFDSKEYHFFNVKTNEEFIGQKRLFRKKYRYDKYTVKCIIQKLTVNQKGWTII